MNKDLAKKNNNLKVRIPMYFVGLFLMTIGIAISVKSNLGVSQITGMEFSKVKIRFDCTMVLISIITCLITIHIPGSVGIGTVIAAVLVGTVLGIVTRLFGQQRDRLLYA